MIKSEPFKNKDLFILVLNMNQFYDENKNINIISISHSSFLAIDNQVYYSSIVTYSINI